MARSRVSQAVGVVAMQMPSLVKYFAYVGAALLGLISLANFLLEPSTGATMVQNVSKPAVVVQHAPGASRIERWRNEQAALKAAAQAPTGQSASLAAKSTPEPVRPAASQTAAAEPAAAQAPAPQLQTQTASAQPAPAAESDQAAEAERKAEKAKAAKAAKKARLARERARAEQAARASGQFYAGAQPRSNQQDAYYYGQRAPQYQNPSYAYAPRQTFGPFGW